MQMPMSLEISFNPCCIGIPLRIKPSEVQARTPEVVFQSLLYWNTSENSADMNLDRFLILFQSLLYWNTSENRVPQPLARLLAEFQSLLYWNTSENVGGLCRPSARRIEVSILVVLEYL